MGRAPLLLAAASAAAIFATAVLCSGMHHDAEAESAWTLLADDVTATVYNAEASQCDADPLRTASMRLIDPGDVGAQRILAMERTMMAEYGISYGDLVLVEGAGRWDGVWTVDDTMNRRFAGEHRIDFLVPEDVRNGLWTGVRISVPAGKPR